MSTFSESWRRAERNVFDWLVGITGDTEGVSCGLADVPPTVNFDSVTHWWEFSISGGGEPLQKDININSPGECREWMMSARVRGVFVTRAEAQDFFGTLEEHMPPADTTIRSVDRLQMAQAPMLEAVPWDREINEDSAGAVAAAARGGPKRVWMLTADMEIIFTADS